MRRALIGGEDAITRQLIQGGGYSDFIRWQTASCADRWRFDEAVVVSWHAGVAADNGDRVHLLALQNILSRAQIKRLTLISTTAVYPNQSLPLSEDANIEEWPNSAVGQLQLRLERWTVEQFASVFIVRLPTLYGPGVTANPMHDLITSGRAHHINPVAIHQWYPLTRLERDIVIARHQRLGVVNLVTEPVSTARIISAFFPHAQTGPAQVPANYSRLTTKYAGLFGGSGGYIMRAHDVLSDMALWVGLMGKDSGFGGWRRDEAVIPRNDAGMLNRIRQPDAVSR